MKKMLALAVVIGVVVTLITGFINSTPSELVGATWYGWPFAWKTVPVVATPTANYDIANFVGDVIVWSVLVGILIGIWQKFRK